LLNDQRFLEVNENENRTYQTQVDTTKAVLRGKFIAISAYIKRTERAHINDLMLPKNSKKNKNKQIPKQAEGEK
jgi:hypothetical protein